MAIVLVSIAAIVRTGMRNQAGPSGDGLWLQVGRELEVVTGDEDNSGQVLRFVLPNDSSRARRIVMPVVRFEDVGMATPAADSGRLPLARAAGVVLALDSAVVKAGKPASRLTVVAVGADLAALRARYPDAGRFLVIGAVMAAHRDSSGVRPVLQDLQSWALHLPTELPLRTWAMVKTGRDGIPFIAATRR
jgi:hypothetical protein